MDSPEQKFFVSDDGKEKLRITKAELQAGIDTGKYGEKTLAWTKGMSGWLSLSDPSWEKHGILTEPEPPELPNPIEDKTPQSSPNAQADSQPFLESKELPGTNPVAERQVPKSKLRFLKDALKAAWIIGLVYVGFFALKTLTEYAFVDSPNLENTETQKNITYEEPANKSIWKIKHFTDDFGEPTGGKYLSTSISGKFSNSFSTNKHLLVSIFVQKKSINFMLYENGSRIVEAGYKSADRYSVQFRRSNGQRGHVTGFNTDNSVFFESHDLDAIHQALLMGGEIKFVLKHDRSSYFFTIEDADGYEAAYSEL